MDGPYHRGAARLNPVQPARTYVSFYLETSLCQEKARWFARLSNPRERLATTSPADLLEKQEVIAAP
jgi:hypothetical protein